MRNMTVLQTVGGRNNLLQINEILSIPVKDSVVQRVIMGDFNSNIAGGENIIESNPGPA